MYTQVHLVDLNNKSHINCSNTKMHPKKNRPLVDISLLNVVKIFKYNKKYKCTLIIGRVMTLLKLYLKPYRIIYIKYVNYFITVENS